MKTKLQEHDEKEYNDKMGNLHHNFVEDVNPMEDTFECSCQSEYGYKCESCSEND